MIPSVNFHLLASCNMSCKHCFVANLSGERLPDGEAAEVVRMLARAGFEKINFAGGEPMLHPNLDALIRTAKESGMTTSIVTNGTRITAPWLDGIVGHLDWIALSVDSACPETHGRSGRAAAGGPLSAEEYLEACSAVRRRGIRLKINTVVTACNSGETMAGFISKARPDRWKIMQALIISGQNGLDAAAFAATDAQFEAFVERNRHVEGVLVVPESNRMMTGSYAMVDPLGRFFDNANGAYAYSPPILEAGVAEALSRVSVDPETFEARGGNYDW